VCELGREAAPFAGTIRHDVLTLLKVLRKYGEAAQVSVVYEAGLTGYGLYRELTGHGYQCQVIAPSLTPHRCQEAIEWKRNPAMRYGSR
jgi:transposase